MASYPIFPTGGSAGAVSRAVRIAPDAKGIRVTLSGGSFTAQIEVSNATPDGSTPEHLFIPAETQWDNAGTVGNADGPWDIAGPVRYLRVKVTAGAVTTGQVMEYYQPRYSSSSQAGLSSADQQALTNIQASASTAQQQAATAQQQADRAWSLHQLSTLSALSAWDRAGTTRAQADGSWWTWQNSGTPNGGTVVAAAGGGVWTREFTSPLNVRWFGAKGDGVTDDSTAITAAVAALNGLASTKTAVLHFPAGVYMIRRGWGLAEFTTVTGERGRSILRLISGLPARTDYLTQTSIFFGLNAYQNTDTRLNRGLNISGLTFELTMPADRSNAGINASPMLGAIKIMNPQQCRIADNIIKNSPSFGVQLMATQFPMVSGDFVTGAVDTAWGVLGNTITGNRVENPTDWYLDTGAINQTSCVALSMAGTCGAKMNGSLTDAFPQDTGNTDYVVANCRGNTVNGNVFIGGSHTIYYTVGSYNEFRGNILQGASHRGVIMGYTCEFNVISGNRIYDIGSTGIQAAYACRHNTVTGNTITRVGQRANISGGEYHAIKFYVNIAHNTITGNAATDCRMGGITVAHGAYQNTISGNTVKASKAGVVDAGNTGIAVNATRTEQYGAGLVYGDTTKAVGNIISANVVEGWDYGIMLTDDKTKTSSVTNNVVMGNNVVNCKTHGVSTNNGTSTTVNANIVAANTFSGNGFNILTTFRTGNIMFGNQGDATMKGFIITSANSTAAAPAAYDQAWAAALLAELRDLKDKLGNGS